MLQRLLRAIAGTLARPRTGPAAGQRAAGSTTPARLAAPPLVSLNGVEMRYGAGPGMVEALRGVSLDLPRGALCVLLGPSGSGKTTLLNIVGGIEQPTRGSVVVDGLALEHLDSRDLTEYRRDHVGFVFQFFNLVPSLTALENVQLVAELVGRGREDAQAALAGVGLADRADHFPISMSGGEQQRVAIARAIVKQPPLLLCDEPTGSLDLATGRQVLGAIRELNLARAMTVLLVTHNAAIAAMADLIIQVGSGAVTGVATNARPAAAGEISW
jgi:putative ABC transport system ATP-binding protein